MKSFDLSFFLAAVALFSLISRSLQAPTLDQRSPTPLASGSIELFPQAHDILHFDAIAPYVDGATFSPSSVELHLSHHQGLWDDVLEKLTTLPCFALVTPVVEGCTEGTHKIYLISGVDFWPASLVARLSIQSASCSTVYEPTVPSNIVLGSPKTRTRPEFRHQSKLGKRSEAADPGIPESTGCEDVLVYNPPASLTGGRYVKGVSRVDLVAAGWDDNQISQYETSNPDVIVT